MGDDAEYYMELQAEEARFIHECELAALAENQKSLFCWINGGEQDLWWSWQPMSRVLNIFSYLHHEKKIGSEYFLSCNLPEQEYEDDYDEDHKNSTEAKEDYEVKLIDGLEEDDYDEDHKNSTEAKEDYEVKLIDGLEFGIVSNANEANSEVIILSQKDIAPLKNEAIRQKGYANNLREQIISEMLEKMVSFMESKPDDNLFVFARDI